MRVLHVITALGVGGAEHMLLKLLQAKALAHCEQHVISMLPGGAVAQQMRNGGSHVRQVDFLGGLPLVSGVLGLARYAREVRPDIIQGWLYHGNLGAAVARACLPRRVPLLWSVRQSLPTLQGENLFARIGIVMNRAGSALPDRLLFNSMTSLAQHRRFGFRVDRSEYLPNGFETDLFRPDARARERWRSQWNLDDSAVVFGLVARYHPVKDHAGFLQAARMAARERPGVRFVLAGAGVDQANRTLMNEIEQAGLIGKVLLLGDQRTVAGLLPALDVYVSSSTAEAFSNSVGEAMSCGLPCVVTDVGDSRLIVAEVGVVVPPRDPAALASAMIEMADMGPSARAALGAQARRRIVDEFEIENIAGRHAALYESLVHPAPAEG